MEMIGKYLALESLIRQLFELARGISYHILKQNLPLSTIFGKHLAYCPKRVWLSRLQR